MPRHHAKPSRNWLTRCRALAARLVQAGRRLLGALRPGPAGPPIAVLTTDRARRHTLERELRRGLRRLKRALGRHLPLELVVVVQHAIHTDRPLAGCCHVQRRADGAPLALLRLALQVDGRRLETDELLGVLAEQLVRIAAHGDSGPSVHIPIEPYPERATPPAPPMVRPDPWTAHPPRPPSPWAT